MKDALLEFVFDNSGEDCLSDLRISNIVRKYVVMIEEIDQEAFSLDQWNYLYQYLTGEKEVFPSIHDVKMKIIEWTKGQ